MEENEEREEGGISVGDIFRIIFSQKWLALIIAVAVTVFGVLWIYVINESNKEYVISFSVELPQANNTDLYYTYPDGSKFYYTDYVSADVINKVRTEQFSGVNAAKVLSGIKFNENIEVLESKKTDDKEIINLRRTFSISINTNAFKSEDIARKYMVELVKYPTNRYAEMALDYNVYLDEDSFKSALTYDIQINYLQSQINYLKSRYDSLSNVADSNGEFLAAKIQQFNAWMERISFDDILLEASVNHYLKDFRTSAAKYLNEIESLKEEIQVYNSIRQGIIDDIKEAGSVNVNDVASTLEPWVVKIAECERKISEYNEYISAYYSDYDENAPQIKQYVLKENYLDTLIVNKSHVSETAEFENKIYSIYDDLVKPGGYIEKTVNDSKNVYAKEATVSFFAPNYITVVDDRMGLVPSILISLAVGVVSAMVIAFIVGWIVNKRKNGAKAAVAEDGNVQLEISGEVQPEEESGNNDEA